MTVEPQLIVEQEQRGLSITFGEIGPFHFGWRWLRDHGEDEASLDPITRQRRVDTFVIDPTQAAISATVIDRCLHVGWPDGHTSVIPVTVLAAVTGAVVPADDREPWTASSAPRPLASFDAVVSDDGALADWLDDVHRHGFAVVEGVPSGLADTTKLIERIAAPRTTIFGTVWTVEAAADDRGDEIAHADSAYTTEALEPHTDGIYSNDGPGFQLLHFTKAAEFGGSSVLVDGLSVVAQLDPTHLDTLTTVDVPGRYVEPGVSLLTRRPPIRLDRHDRFLQLSFNNYDRAPMWLPPAQMDAFYDAYNALHDRIIDPANRLELTVEEGQALIFDNWRLLHGRTGFTGDRRFQGAYLNQEDVESRRRSLAAELGR